MGGLCGKCKKAKGKGDGMDGESPGQSGSSSSSSDEKKASSSVKSDRGDALVTRGKGDDLKLKARQKKPIGRQALEKKTFQRSPPMKSRKDSTEGSNGGGQKVFIGFPTSRRRWRLKRANTNALEEMRGSFNDRAVHYSSNLVLRHVLFANQNYCARHYCDSSQPSLTQC